ncbi:hypothetical protein ACWFMH_18810 [Bacillus altitudinis]
MIAVMQNGATLVRNLTLSGGANGIVSALMSYKVGETNRLLMGTSTGELWASDDAGVTATRLPYTGTGKINGIGFDGARLIVGTLTATNMIQVSTDNGATWTTESNPSVGGISALAGIP